MGRLDLSRLGRVSFSIHCNRLGKVQVGILAKVLYLNGLFRNVYGADSRDTAANMHSYQSPGVFKVLPWPIG